MSIMVTRSSMPDLDEYIKEIKPIFDNHYLTNGGAIHKKLQEKLKEYLGVPRVSLFANGHLALEMAIEAVGIRSKGGEIITTPFTFVSTTHAIVRNGLKPVFCDIDPENYTLDVAKVEALITEKTVAILPVHVYGNLCNVEAIEELAKRYDLKVIYDAAHAFGVKYKGKGVGNFGDASMFSFHATKVFNTVEGGAVSFNEPELSKKMALLKNFGICGPESVTEVGSNAKLDEFRAAIGCCNLKRIDKCIAKRAKIAEKYNELLGDTLGIRIHKTQKDVSANYAYYPVCFDEKKFGESRDDVYERLIESGVFARKYFYPAINELECYKEYYSQATPIAHAISLSILTLPIYEELALEEVEHICEIILNGRQRSREA